MKRHSMFLLILMFTTVLLAKHTHAQDYTRWNLPEGATVRLGKGALAIGDRSVALSADRRYLAVASAIGVWLYEASSSQALALLPTGAAHSVSFSPNGTLAAGLNLGRVELWDVDARERTGTLKHTTYMYEVSSVVFSKDGTVLASVSTTHDLHIWEMETKRLLGTWRVPSEGRGAHHMPVAFSPDGSQLVSGSGDGLLTLYNVATQTEVGTLKGHSSTVTSVSFSPDGGLLASAGRHDDVVRLWDAATQTEVATLRGHTNEVRSVSFSPDGATLASGGGWGDATIRLWDVATRTEMATMERHGGLVYSVTFSRDGATLVSGDSYGAVLLWDLETANAAGPAGHVRLTSMALTPDGRLLASGHGEGAVRLWDMGTRTLLGTLEGHRGAVTSVAFAPDSGTLASGGDGTVRLWDVNTRELIGTLEGYSIVNSVSFSPDGAILASGGWPPTVKLWDVATREAIGILEGHEKQVRSVAFSPPDGTLLASSGTWGDGTVRLWDVRTRDMICTLEGHDGEVLAFAFSPDGKTLSSSSWDGKIRLWDVSACTLVHTLGGTPISIAFSPDGQTLASGSGGGCGCWTWPRGGHYALSSQEILTASIRWRFRRMGRPWPAAVGTARFCFGTRRHTRPLILPPPTSTAMGLWVFPTFCSSRGSSA